MLSPASPREPFVSHAISFRPSYHRTSHTLVREPFTISLLLLVYPLDPLEPFCACRIRLVQAARHEQCLAQRPKDSSDGCYVRR